MTHESPLSRLEKLAKEHANPANLSEVSLSVKNHMETAAENFIEGGKAMLSLLSEPGEACRPRVWITWIPSSGPDVPSATRCDVPESKEYCDVAELLQARAAHASEVGHMKALHELAGVACKAAKEELITERAALASSEARVSELEAVARFYSTYSPRQHPDGYYEINVKPGEGGEVRFGTLAREALLEVQQ